MIVLLGATGYIGQAFASALRQRNECFIPLSREALDYNRFEYLFDYLRKIKPELVINAVDCPHLPNEGASDIDRMEMLQSNALLPQTVGRACGMTNTPWGQISSGSIYSGAKILEKEKFQIEKDLSQPALRKFFSLHPEKFFGFSELDQPNFSFNTAPCSFYSGTKALAEESIRGGKQNYVWRLRLPFNAQDDCCNFISQLQGCSSICGAVNSLSHLDDCVAACLELWERRAPFGIYNLTNPGAITTEEIIDMVNRILKPARSLETCVNGCNLLGSQARWPEPNCILDTSKVRRTGVKIRHVRDALKHALEKWQKRAYGLPRHSAQSTPIPELH
jgi:dTDP-4-dehydrorhamnose reductase